jgi:hypothetical protein
MGNSNSSENRQKRNYKVYKITSKSERENYTRCYLNGCVPYKDGNHEHMDFKNEGTRMVFEFVGDLFAPDIPRARSAYLLEGVDILVDIDMTREYNSSHDFSR